MVGSGSRPGLLHSADGVVPPVRETSFDVAAFVRSAFGDRLREADEDLRPPDLSPDLRGALTYLGSSRFVVNDPAVAGIHAT
ncbi:MAG: hypothetical protein ACTHYM_13885, partial [Actinomycetaceae bacterium]